MPPDPGPARPANFSPMGPADSSPMGRGDVGTPRGDEPAAAGRATLVDRVAGIVRRYPHAPALDFGDRVVSYGELWRRAGALAVRILGTSPTPPRRIGLWSGRNLSVFVGYLAAL